MKFLAIFFLVVIHRNWVGGNLIRDQFSLDSWFSMVAAKSSGGYVRFFFSVVLPSVVLFLICLELRGWFFGLFWIILSLSVLIYCTDVVDIDIAFDDQFIWLRALNEEDDIANSIQTQATFFSDVTYDVFRSVIPVLFWFLVLGPGVALFFFLCQHYTEELSEEDREWDLIENILYWMEWIPARIAVLLFAIVGEFSKTWRSFVDSIFETKSGALETLALGACAAAGHTKPSAGVLEDFVSVAEAELMELKSLLERSLLAWLGLAAALTILGW